MSKGKLLFVVGYSGSGKTTLVRSALGQIPALRYLKTFITRPPRPGEQETSYEYQFISQADYNRRRAASRHWDHTEFAGHSYGSEVDATQKLLDQGVSVICSVALEVDAVNDMRALYSVQPVIIWIDTPQAVARQRLAQLDATRRLDRKETDEARALAHIIFKPSLNLAQDQAAFAALIRRILTGKEETDRD